MVLPLRKVRKSKKELKPFFRAEILNLINLILDTAAKKLSYNSSEKAARGSGLGAFFWAVPSTHLLAAFLSRVAKQGKVLKL